MSADVGELGVVLGEPVVGTRPLTMFREAGAYSKLQHDNPGLVSEHWAE